MKSYLTAVSAMALSVGLAACVDVPKPQYPVRAEPAAAPAPAPAPVPQAPPAVRPPAPAADGSPQAKPTTSVEQSTLAPPPGAKVAPAPRRKPGASLDRYPGDGRPTLVLAAYSADPSVFEAAKKKAKRVSRAKAEETSDQTVTIGKGDTLATIAKAHGTTIEALAAINGLKSPYRVNAGQSLKLAAAPSEEASARTAKGKAAAKSAPAAPEQVTVGKGDTLAAIAKKAGVSVAELAEANGLKKPYRLKRGQTLNLTPDAAASDAAPETGAAKPRKSARAEAAEPAGEGATSTITVRRKDTIQSLAKDAKVSVAELARLNHLKKPYRLKPGQKIEVPDQPGSALEREISSSAPKRATVVIAGRRDTLQSIARKEGLRVDELARLNGIKKPYRIKRGQKIKLPVRSDIPASTAPALGKAYQVQSGDTLYSIARRFGTDARTLAELNGLDAGAALKSGRRIRLPGAASEEQAAPKPSREPPVEPRTPREPPAEAAPPTTGRQPSAPVPYSSLPNPAAPPPPGQRSAPTPPPTPSPRIPPVVAPPPYRPPPPVTESTTPADADVADAGKGLFVWPVRGQTLQAFGPIANGQRNDGLDIAAGQGAPVVASAAGEVVYAGSSVPTFGNMVLIRHEGGWVTVYAHLANIDVKMRQTVTQGQQIGEVGMTGGVSQPQVHFEVRYNPSAKDKPRPIDPSLVLPK
jgi:murein DD-endopeptidase MepM/ murein hydrolase activator NlpD